MKVVAVLALTSSASALVNSPAGGAPRNTRVVSAASALEDSIGAMVNLNGWQPDSSAFAWGLPGSLEPALRHVRRDRSSLPLPMLWRRAASSVWRRHALKEGGGVGRRNRRRLALPPAPFSRFMIPRRTLGHRPSDVQL